MSPKTRATPGAAAPERKYMYRSTVKELGLTDAMLRELGAPDKLVPNPHYRGGPPAALYQIARVELWIEQHAERVQQARERRQARSARMTAVAQERSAKLLAWARAFPIEVAPLPGLCKLQRQTEEAFLDFTLDRGRAGDFTRFCRLDAPGFRRGEERRLIFPRPQGRGKT